MPAPRQAGELDSNPRLTPNLCANPRRMQYFPLILVKHVVEIMENQLK